MSIDKQTIQTFNEGFLKLIHSRDVEAIVNFYTVDALLLPPGTKAIKGHDSIRAFWNEFIGLIEKFTLSTTEVKMLGSDNIRELGTFSMASTDKTQPLITGKYIVVWEKVGDVWKFAVDIWNADS